MALSGILKVHLGDDLWLNLNDKVNYRWDNWTPPVRRRVRSTVEGPGANGRDVVQTRLDTRVVVVELTVYGDDFTHYAANVAALESAFDQWAPRFVLDIGGHHIDSYIEQGDVTMPVFNKFSAMKPRPHQKHIIEIPLREA